MKCVFRPVPVDAPLEICLFRPVSKFPQNSSRSCNGRPKLRTPRRQDQPMHNKIAQVGGRRYQAIIHGHAVSAAVIASCSAAIPGPLGVLIDVTGIDPVRGVQAMMLQRLAAHGGSVTAVSASSQKPVGQRELRRYARQLAKTAVSGSVKRRIAAMLGRRAKYAVPIAGSALAAFLAYRETYLLAVASLPPHRGSTPKGLLWAS